MAQRANFVQGDDIRQPVQLTINNATFDIPDAATVRAAVVNCQTETVVGPVTLTHGTTGDDWDTSLVVVVIPAATSADLTVGQSLLEIEVDDGEVTTWQIDTVVSRKQFIANA